MDVFSLPALDILYPAIPYGQLEPGDFTDFLDASTTILAVGNTGLDNGIEGSAMCPGFAVGFHVRIVHLQLFQIISKSSTSSGIAYNTTGQALSSTTPFTLETQIKKSTSTSQFSSGKIYWGIGVPIEITTAGAYTGLNIFTGIGSATTTWY